MTKEHMERARTAILRWHTPTIADNFIRLAALLAGVLLLSTFAAVPAYRIFGHDEVHYYQDISLKLVEDGRWLNYLLHDFLRSIPLGTWACLFMALSWLLSYRLARSLSFDAAYAALVASTIVLAYPFAEQILWPATAMPAMVILLGASLLVERGVGHPVVYMLSGVLMFGSLQTPYFLLPLFFLPQFLPGTQAGERRWPLLFSHMCWWVGGSVAGVLAMSLVLWLMSGHFGPQPADWRLTQPVEDGTSLIRNILYVSEAFIAQLERFLRTGGVTWGFIVVLALAVLLRARALLAMHHAMLLLAAVVLSFFAFSIPLAPLIHQRSLIAMAVAVLLFIALLPGSSAMGRVFGALLLLKFAYGFSVNDKNYLSLREAEMGYFYEKLQELIPGNPLHYSAMALYGTMDAGRPEAFVFNDPSLMHPIFISLRAVKYLDCRLLDSRCDPVGAGKQISALPFGNGQLQFSVDAANVGIVRYIE